MRDPERRARIIAEAAGGSGLGALVRAMPHMLFPLDDPPDYEPPPESSVAAVAARTGGSVDDVFYDLLLQRDGEQLVLFTLGGYANNDAGHIGDMLRHPEAMLGLADGGAHCSLICDASVYTSMLAHWVRDRTRGERLPIELVVRTMTSVPAAVYGFGDRGVIEPGRRADLNVIDLDALSLELPEVVADLPTGATRLVQAAHGYEMTMVAGVAVTEHDTDTGARPGGLVARRKGGSPWLRSGCAWRRCSPIR